MNGGFVGGDGGGGGVCGGGDGVGVGVGDVRTGLGQARPLVRVEEVVEEGGGVGYLVVG